MATSIPGGATMAADGKTWQDASGQPLKREQITAIEALHSKRTDQRNAAEAARLASEAQSNPIASALMALLGRAPMAPQPALAPRPQTLADVVGQEYAEKLAQAGVTTLGDIADLSDDELLAVEGIGPATVKKLRAAQG